MRLTLHWQGKPLLAVDLVATSPEDDEPDGPALEASGQLQDSTLAESIEPDTRVFGIGPRPEGLR